MLKTHMKNVFWRQNFPVARTGKVTQLSGDEGYVADRCARARSPRTGFIHKISKGRVWNVDSRQVILTHKLNSSASTGYDQTLQCSILEVPRALAFAYSRQNPGLRELRTWMGNNNRPRLPGLLPTDQERKGMWVTISPGHTYESSRPPSAPAMPWIKARATEMGWAVRDTVPSCWGAILSHPFLLQNVC